VKVAGRWTYLYRAVDEFGQIIDVLVSTRRNADAARAFFACAATFGPAPVEVSSDRAPVYPPHHRRARPGGTARLRAVRHNAVEADHGRLKARLGAMRGMKTIGSLRTIAAGHAFVQNLRRGHYELALDRPSGKRVRAAFGELARAV
jgi:transposase-like protein